MKDEFISTVSHELRTPLTSLRGALGLLAGGALVNRPEKTQQMLEIASALSKSPEIIIRDEPKFSRLGKKVNLSFHTEESNG